MNSWNAILDNIQKNWEAYSGMAGAIALAVISCIPENPPSTFAEWWTWGRSALQTAIPTRHGPANPPLIPEPPPHPTQPATAPEKEAK